MDQQESLATGAWTATAGSLQGSVRARQEDRFVLRALPGGGLMAAVLDGVGGEPRGAEAAEACAHALRVGLDWDGPTAALAARLNECARTAGGCTTVALVVLRADGSGRAMRAGDSNLYLVGPALEPVFPVTAPGVPLVNYLGGQAPPILEVANLHLAPSQRVLLCTDGVDGVLGPAALARASSGPGAREAVLAAVMAAGSPDNATLVLVGPQI